VGKFRWLDTELLPAAYDLRRRGWTLAEPDCTDLGEVLGLLPYVAVNALQRVAPERRTVTLLVGVGEAAERAALLRDGFGDAIGLAPDLDELEARAARVLALARHEPRSRHHGALKLDLLARDAFVAGRSVGLHPREFALLWRLMAAAGEPLDKVSLLAEVWRLHHIPETNSLPVHVSRLRRKLAEAGFPEVIVTKPEGYAYVAPRHEPRPALPLAERGHGLDAHVIIADEVRQAGPRDERDEA
jgi:two-component system, OmpR family, response regulator